MAQLLQRATISPRLTAMVWSASLAFLAGGLGFSLFFGLEGLALVGAIAIVSACGAIVGAGLSDCLWASARSASLLRGVAWGVLGSFLTVQMSASLIGWIEYGSSVGSGFLDASLGMAIMTIFFGWWLVIPAGVFAGLAFVLVFRQVALPRIDAEMVAHED